MLYHPEPFPYDHPLQDMKPSELKRTFEAIMESMSRRVANISGFLCEAHGVRLTPECSDEEIDRLSWLIASLGGRVEMSEEEFEARLAGVPEWKKEVFRSIFPRGTMSDETLLMAFDGALLWGEAYRIRYPLARWTIGRKPKSSIHCGQPVLVGDDPNYEFGPFFELRGHVSSLTIGQPHTWSLSELMRMRAFSMGFGPDARLEGVPRGRGIA